MKNLFLFSLLFTTILLLESKGTTGEISRSTQNARSIEKIESDISEMKVDIARIGSIETNIEKMDSKIEKMNDRIIETQLEITKITSKSEKDQENFWRNSNIIALWLSVAAISVTIILSNRRNKV